MKAFYQRIYRGRFVTFKVVNYEILRVIIYVSPINKFTSNIAPKDKIAIVEFNTDQQTIEDVIEAIETFKDTQVNGRAVYSIFGHIPSMKVWELAGNINQKDPVNKTYEIHLRDGQTNDLLGKFKEVLPAMNEKEFLDWRSYRGLQNLLKVAGMQRVSPGEYQNNIAWFVDGEEVKF